MATGAFYGTSIGFMIAAGNQAAGYNALASRRIFTDVAVITGLLGSAVGVGTAICVMTIPYWRPERATHIVPMASVNAGRVMLTGRW